MGRFLRNIRIHTAMVAVLAMFMLFIVAIAGMGVVAERSANRTLLTLDQISSDQLNEINRADSMLNVARTSLEAAANYMMRGRMEQADQQLAIAADRLQLAEQRYQRFNEAPKTDRGVDLADAVSRDFELLLSLVRQQWDALDAMQTTQFNELREELKGPSEALASSMSAFVDYGFARVDTLVENYRDQSHQFEWIGLTLLLVVVALVGIIYVALRRVIIRPLNRAVESLDAIAKADLTVSIPEGSRNEVGRLFSAMRGMQQSLTRIVGDVRTSSESIHVGTREIASGNADLSSRTEQQAASLEETASSMEELTTTVRQNADNARQASGLAVEASNTAERGGEVVDRVVTTMDGISDSSKKISDITGLIDSIAFQTNILALNASVEAARAGEQGRGFAVVAGEVRNLASRSATAAKDIKALIDGSVAQIKDGSVLAREAGETMQEVVKAVRRVTDIMDEISAASQEQSDGIEQVSQAVGQMDQVTQQNASLVQEATAAAASLEEQASRLEQAVAVFRLSAGAEAAATPAQGPRSSAHELAAATGVPVLAQPNHAARMDPTPKPRSSARPEAAAEAEWEEF